MLGIQFKEAETAEELAQIHRLNHSIFSEEIGQHDVSDDGLLIDRFHAMNRYFIAKIDGDVAGMVSMHEGPDFSVTRRLHDPSILRSLRFPVEVRLLAVAREHRNSGVFAGLLLQVHDHARRLGYSDLLISGIVAREPMYRKLGFKPMGPAVAEGDASFIPMRLCLDQEPPEFSRRAKLHTSHRRRQHSVSLLPGPVEIAESVTGAFHAQPVSHRGEAFVQLYEEARSRLSSMMGGMHAVILGGSGTLANDAVAANLRAAFPSGRGLLLANGEFGERLIRQAHLAGLNFRSLRFPWGEPWNFAQIEEELTLRPAFVWAVHLETSTGVLNDLPRLIDLAARFDAYVAADCVSSIGVVDPHGDSSARLFLATGVSGKALGSYAGLCFVFASAEALNRVRGRSVCATFDIAGAAESAGPVSTVSSPLVCALAEAIRLNCSTPSACTARYAHHRELGRWVRQQLRNAGLPPLAAEENAAPTITTFAMPGEGFARECHAAGFRIAHESDYLRTRNWGQLATMGQLDQAVIEPLFDALAEHARHKPSRTCVSV